MRGIVILLTSLPLYLFAVGSDECSLICKHGVQVEVDGSCVATVELATILLGFGDPSSCLSTQINDFELSIMEEREGAIIVEGAQPFPAIYIGDKLWVKVEERSSGNYCYGSIMTYDTKAPELICPDPLDLTFDEVAPLPNEMLPIYDDCGTVTFSFEDQLVYTDCVSGFYKKTLRIWTGTDPFGNSATCEHEIGFRAPELELVDFPQSLSDTFLDCAIDITNTALIGEPLIDGKWGLDSFNLLHLTAGFEDEIIEECSGNAFVNRYWTVGDFCNGTSIEAAQEFVLRDTTPPSVICPDTLDVNALENTELSPSFTLPLVQAVDACSELVEYEVQMLGDTFLSNGPLLSELPIGLIGYAYEVTDDCGNASKCRSAIKVFPPVGYDYPVLLCPGLDTVYLDDLGNGALLAEDLAISTLDNRCMDGYQIRVADSANFSDLAAFNCLDLGGIQLISVEGTDCESTKGYCSVEVLVLDTIPPLLTCPSTLSITCLEDAADLSLTGRATLTDACSESVMTYSDVLNLNNCGLGEIIRVWEGGDNNGPLGRCEQLITIGADIPFSIVFPRSYTIIGCADSADLAPENLPTNNSFPVITAGTCSDYSVSYRDSIFQDSLSCMVVFRAWKVQDHCSFESAGIYEWIQFIRVIDGEAPNITCPSPIDVALPFDQCEVLVDLPLPTWDEECEEPMVELLGDLQGGTIFDNLTVGEYQLEYQVTDWCGNASNCPFTLMIEDVTGPVFDCPSEINIELEADLTAELGIQELNIGSIADNCYTMEELLFGLTFQIGDTIPPIDTLLTFDCSTPSEIQARLWIGDAEDHWNSCVFSISVANISCATDGETAALQPVIYPNPAKAFLYFNTLREKEGRADLLVRDKFGRVIYSDSVILNQGKNSWMVHTHTWPKGILFYELRIAGSSTTSGTILIVD